MADCDLCAEVVIQNCENIYRTCGDSTCACGKLERLNRRVSEAEDLLQNLYHQRHDLMPTLKLNVVHPSIIHRMPVEISTNIFALCLDFCTPLDLGAVCQAWRNLVWSTPSLWASIDLSFGPFLTPSHIDITQEWLERARGLPLWITFSIRGGFRDHWWQRLYPLVDLLSDHAWHWYFLDLDCLPGPLLHRFSDLEHTSSTLRRFSLKGSGSSPTSLNIRNFRAEFLRLEDPNFDLADLCWTDVTEIRAVLALNQILRAFELAPRVTICAFEVNKCIEDFTRTTPFLHPFVQSLVLQSGSSLQGQGLSLVFKQLLNGITLPALERLTIEVDSDQTNADMRRIDTGSALCNLLIRSACTLKELSISGLSLTNGNIIQIARTHPSLTKLSLFSSIATAWDANYLLSILPNEPLLPSLECFTFDSGRAPFPWDLLPGLFLPFALGTALAQRPLRLVDISCDCSTIPKIGSDIMQQLATFASTMELKMQVRSGERSNRKIDLLEKYIEEMDAVA
ncbi:hypothetical protein CVT26_007824 [Gymnopilus dilepis]|uniref:F-box domain-containing protein n=1 Tax=Gymnopilus dilepis TaxID=231916 RepID=A0A409W7T8_9AGAR|nr:hypothetical protein CVT26_007824 [Gymnopilus dilepis]